MLSGGFDAKATPPRAMRQSVHAALCALAEASAASLPERLDRVAASDCHWRVAHPMNELRGNAAALASVWQPLLRAFPDLERRDAIFVAGSYDGQHMRVFVDGLEVGRLAVTGALSTAPTTPAALGNQPEGGRAFDGLIDDARLYSRALSAEELRIVAGLARRTDCPGTTSAGG